MKLSLPSHLDWTQFFLPGMLSVLPAFFLLMASSSSAWSSASILAPLEGSLPWCLACRIYVSQLLMDLRSMHLP